MADQAPLIILITLLFSAFFSGLEIAFVSADKFRIELEKKQGNFSAKVISFLVLKPAQYIAAMLVGNNVALVIYGIAFATLIEPPIKLYISNSPLAILLIQTLISTLVILVTAEFIPKTLFRISPNKMLNFFAIPVLIIYFIFYPITLFTVYISRLMLRLFFKVEIQNTPNKVVFGKIDLDNFLKIEHSGNQNEEFENDVKIFKNALDFSRIKLRACIVPRNEIVAVHINTPIEEVKIKFTQTGLSKILVYKDSLDDIIGYIHSHEIFKKPKTIKAAMGSIIIAPETMQANKLLNKFIAEKKNIAIIVDEFGGTAGMVTIEDIMEEIFGEIEDEHDLTTFTEQRISEKEFVFSGRLEIDYLNEKYALNLPESEEYETLAGLILQLCQKIPIKNEEIMFDNIALKIMDINGPKIETISLIIMD